MQGDLLGGAQKHVVSTAELCDLFDVSKVAVHHWRKAGMPAMSRDRYDLGQVIRWWRARYDERRPGKELEDDDERRALIIAQTRKYEVETARLEAVLIPRDEVMHMMSTLAALVASTMEGAPARLAAEMAELRGDVPSIRDALLKEFRALREQIARQVDAYADAPTEPADTQDGGVDTETAPDTDRRRVGRRKPRAASDVTRARGVVDGASTVLEGHLPSLQ
jgi:phage terminase Nu1 subunit (DNA packaging protein)